MRGDVLGRKAHPWVPEPKFMCYTGTDSVVVIGLAPRAIIPVSKDGQRGGKADLKSYIVDAAYDRSGAQRFLKWPWVHALA